MKGWGLTATGFSTDSRAHAERVCLHKTYQYHLQILLFIQTGFLRKSFVNTLTWCGAQADGRPFLLPQSIFVTTFLAEIWWQPQFSICRSASAAEPSSNFEGLGCFPDEAGWVLRKNQIKFFIYVVWNLSKDFNGRKVQYVVNCTSTS